MKTATLIRDLRVESNGVAVIAKQSLYRLSEPLFTDWADDAPEPFDYVVVSAAVVPWSGPETYIFGANEAGKILNFLELPGSFRGDLDHEAALSNAGYKVMQLA